MTLTDAQKNALKDLAILGAIYFGTKTVSSVVRYGVIAGVGYLLYQNYQSVKSGVPGLSGGWRVKVDPGMAVDMLFPKLGADERQYARLAATHLISGWLPQ